MSQENMESDSEVDQMESDGEVVDQIESNWLYNFVSDGEDFEDDDDFVEIMNEVDGDEKTEKASNDNDFEDDNNDGDDD
ncbi:hypothetical protein P8452_39573 [Trifolium repens]|nr:hypothetical protein P8452_39573 [Trifolium repens]